MMAGIRILFIPFILAVLLHGILVSLFLFSFESKPTVIKNKPIPEIIQASVLDENKVLAEAQRIKTEQNKKKIATQNKQKKLQRERQQEEWRITELKKKRLAEEALIKQRKREQKKAAVKEQKQIKKLKQQRLKQEQLIAEQQKKLAEQARLEKQRIAKDKKRKQQEAKRQEKQKQQKIAKEKQRQQQQEVMRKEAERLKIQKQQAIAEQRRLVEQQAEQDILAKQKAAQESKAMHTAQYAIQRKVNSRWVRPLSVRSGLKCTIRVKLLASGDVVQAVVVKSSGDPVFDRSAETAVRKAAPLPVPTDYELFSREFRAFDFIFNPK